MNSQNAGYWGSQAAYHEGCFLSPSWKVNQDTQQDHGISFSIVKPSSERTKFSALSPSPSWDFWPPDTVPIGVLHNPPTCSQEQSLLSFTPVSSPLIPTWPLQTRHCHQSLLPAQSRQSLPHLNSCGAVVCFFLGCKWQRSRLKLA